MASNEKKEPAEKPSVEIATAADVAKASHAATSSAATEEPDDQAQRADPGGSHERAGFLVVGIGASAGGLQALEDLFTNMPPNPGMAFVIVTHQHAGHPSLMAELLGRKTSMPVVEVSKATVLERDHVYTIQPGLDAALLSGVLQPTELRRHALRPMPVDYFFRSLAQDQGERAIGVVLSGTGSDGAIGVKEIKAALGLVIAQDEATAQYRGMPHSAIATEVVDHVLPATEITQQLVEYARTLARGLPPALATVPSSDELQQIFVLIRSRTGHDFSQYKETTVRRRVERRMALHHLDTMKRYLRFVQATPAELDILFKELLIGVTSFFRDPEAWASLAGSLGPLLAQKPDHYVVRAWIPGCSTGEEAYSLAILLREIMEEQGRSLNVQVFATDLDPDAIEAARSGLYPAGIANDVSARRLGRFFSREEDTYRVRKEVREMVIFAPQDIVGDPPFTKLDVLCCRNLLIYLNASVQRKLIPIFHYALKPSGILMLGSSETVGGFGDLFSAVDKRWKIFQRQPVAQPAYTTEFRPSKVDLGAGVAPRRLALGAADTALNHAVERTLLRDLVPPTVLVQERGDVVHIHGRTGLFLEPAPGPHATANIFNMARPGLSVSLSAALRQAAAEEKEVVHRGVHVKSNGALTSVDLKVERLTEPDVLRGLFRVAFANAAAVPAQPEPVSGDGTATSDRLAELERELQYTKEGHQATIEELETANEELKSTNEELQSTNEELQSANEELETSKEEMQSLNEELQTVNAELQGKVEELSRTNDDMRNLLNSTDIATIFLDDELRIKRFTEQATKVVRLIPSDIGRPIGDLVSSLRYARLLSDAREVLRSLVRREAEVQADNGAWYLMRILPYRTIENVISGLVLTFVDVTAGRELQEEQRRLLEALKGSPTSVFVADGDLRYAWVAGGAFGRTRAQLSGKTDEEVFGANAAKALVDAKRKALESKTAARTRVILEHDGRERSYDLYVEPLRNPDGEVTCLTCAATVIDGDHWEKRDEGAE